MMPSPRLHLSGRKDNMPRKYLPGFDDPSVLREIEPSRLFRLIAPHRQFFADHGYELPTDPVDLDCERLAVLLLQPQPDTPPELVDALTHIHEVATTRDVEFLRAQAQQVGVDIPLHLNMSPTDVAVHIWLERPEALRRYHAERVVLRRRSFEMLMASEDATFERPADLSAGIKSLDAAVNEFYNSIMDRGRGAYIIPIETQRELRLVIPHGAPYCRRGCWRESKPSSVGFRPMEFAYAVLDWENWELRLNCKTKREREFFKSQIGLHILGQSGFFTQQQKYTLDPLRRGREALVCSGVPGVRHVRLAALTMKFGGAFGRMREESADDLLLALECDGDSIPLRAELVKAKFEFVFTDSEKPRPVTLMRGNRATYTRDSDSALVERFFELQNFSRSVARASLAVA